MENINIMDKPPTPILDSKDIQLEPTSSLTSNSSGNYIYEYRIIFSNLNKLLNLIIFYRCC